jgi:hypothetical protein
MSKVTLNVTINGNYLDVSQVGNGANPQHGATVTVTWRLTGNAASGTFNAINDPSNPGFSWIQQPPAGIFSAPQLAADGKEISLTDTNGDNAIGSWIYKLCATIGTRPYSTDPTSSGSATGGDTSMTVDFASNPTIQNR